MWRELADEILVEIAFMQRTAQDLRGLARRMEVQEPTAADLAAAGAMLHSYYNGVENCFKRIARSLDGEAPRGSNSHAALLSRMTQRAETRQPVISETLALELREYLRFRHLFRYAYHVQFKWDEMKPLVDSLDGVQDQLESQLRAFIERVLNEPKNP